MAWTSTDLSALEDAIAAAAIRGYAEVAFSGRVARRYTIRELLDLREQMKAALSGASGKVSSTFGQFSKG